MTKHLALLAALALVGTGGCGTSTPASAGQPPASDDPGRPTEVADKKGMSLPTNVTAMTVDRLASLLARAANTVAVFDANSDKTRSEVGYIPGATLLADYRNCADKLPADKDRQLVFYCYNERCGASHRAAELAVAEGYQRVSVLPAGIVGWAESGQPVEKL
jgi:rhodanese-related sulfurtransferase